MLWDKIDTGQMVETVRELSNQVGDATAMRCMRSHVDKKHQTTGRRHKETKIEK